MADNTTLDPGSGGDTVRAEDRAGVKTQIVGLDLNPAAGAEDLMAGTMPVSGTVTANLSATDNAVLDDIAADTEAIKTAVEILDNTVSGAEMQVDVVGALPAGTNAIGKLAANSGVDIGDVDVISSALPTGASTSAKQDTIIGHLDGVEGSLTTLAGAVAGTEVQADVLTLPGSPGSTIAHDAADSGNPHKIGGKAGTADQTAVANGDRTDARFDALGHQVVRPYALHENLWSDSAGPITDTASTEVKAAPGAGVRLYVTSALVTNADTAVGTNVQLTDGSGGTVKWEGYAHFNGGGWSCTFPTPLRLTANTALHAICGTTSSETRVSAAGYTAAV